MKKIISTILLLSLFIISCDGKKKEQEKLQETKNLEIIKKEDSISVKVENIKKEIEKSSKELDELINNL